MSVADQRGLRALILTQATRLFALQGFAATSIRELVEACDCTKPALYYYFDGKEALFRAVVEDHRQQLNLLLQGHTSGAGSVRQRLHASIGAVVDHCIENSLAMRLLQRIESSPEYTGAVEDTCAAREMHMQMLVTIVGQGIDTGELRSDLAAEDAALVLIGAMHFQFELSIASGQWNRDQVLRSIDLILDGIAV